MTELIVRAARLLDLDAPFAMLPSEVAFLILFLFTNVGMSNFCLYCGHGGHTQHLAEWFSKETKCPTGCGCDCSVITSM